MPIQLKRCIYSCAFFLLIFNSSILAENKLTLAAKYKEKFQYDKAIALLKDQQDNLGKEYLARLYYLNGQIKKALELFFNLENKSWYSYIYLGLIYEDLKKFDLAITNYQKSIDLNKNSIGLYRLAKIYYSQKKLSLALDYFLQLSKFDPSIRIVNYYLGDYYLNLGDYSKSYEFLAKACNFYPDNQEMKNKLKLAKSKLGERFFSDIKQAQTIKRQKVKLSEYIRQEEKPYIRVGLGKNLNNCRLKCGDDFIFDDGSKIFNARRDQFYNLMVQGVTILLYDKEDKLLATFGRQVWAKSKNMPFYILDIVYGDGSFWHKEKDFSYRGDLIFTLKDKGMSLVNYLSLEEYLYGVLPSEIPATWPKEALKAQAVAARTSAVKNIGRHDNEGFDLCADVHCQVYQGRSLEQELTNQAVDETKGEILDYKGILIDTFYHANCGGCLRSDAFMPRPYLADKFDVVKGKLQDIRPEQFTAYEEELWFLNNQDVLCANQLETKSRWQRIYDQQDFQFIFGYPLKQIKKLVIESKERGFHNKKILLDKKNKKIILDKDLSIRDYFDKLKSSSFKLEIGYGKQHQLQMLIFWGAGFGHGSGLCQEGARAMAKEGYNYKDILKHYYPVCKIRDL